MHAVHSGIDWQQLAEFIARMNRRKEHHVGYCGEKAEEIFDTLLEEFDGDGKETRRFTVITAEDRIIGALGFQADEESRSAELWGPFIDAEQAAEWNAIANRLWSEGLAKQDIRLERALGFYNIENEHCAEWMAGLGAKRTGVHTVLKSKGKAPTSVSFGNTGLVSGVQNLSPEDRQAFRDLHDLSFPDTYYSADQILGQLDEDRRLFVAVEDGRLAGYVYVEADPEHKEGSIEYIAVSGECRRRGYGKALLGKALAFLFGTVRAEEISLCVSRDNIGAIRLYESMGFETEHELGAYVLAME